VYLEIWLFVFCQFNFVGKILGPQGNTIKRLQEETGAKISVLGKGSMRDKAKVSS
jgi:RNA-binding signal transduction-associated protein 1 with KH domain